MDKQAQGGIVGSALTKLFPNAVKAVSFWTVHVTSNSKGTTILLIMPSAPSSTSH